ncbi:glycosyltransferase 87 family protein [Nocardia sp. NBC_01503]|uniref:glycosyltransferase 87 family protein n=1 Tax=Nocardia sp. NBC_01503 TaxID=2975997 RepID=UPI002E7B5976|nr:glycosyltransferase 87 family protein [Nocardia sp. NBC_01503]WTL29302.1 glycosyltransferase 87 family protein [Nocardia sp. NBC_01503]
MLRVGLREFERSGATVSVLGVGAVLAVVLVLTTVNPWMSESGGILAGGLDAHVYRDGAERVLQGRPLYTEPTFFGLLYTYTPFSALVFLPIAAIPWSWITYASLLLNVFVLFGCVLLCWRALGYRVTPRLAGVSALLTLTCLFLEPVRTTMFYGQINLVLMLLVLWDFSRADDSRIRGIGVGVAAGIKLVPGYFVVQYLALRQWRSAAVAALTFLGTIALAWVILPEDSHRYWFSTFFQSDRIAPDTNPANQSIRGVLAHLSHGAAPLWLWLVVTIAVTFVSLVVTVALDHRGERLLAATLAGMTACAVSPFAWGHHWVWFVPLMVHLVDRAQSNPRWWGAAALLFVGTGAWAYHWGENYVSVGIFLLPKPWHSEPILENSHVLMYLAALAYGVFIAKGRTRWRDWRSIMS